MFPLEKRKRKVLSLEQKVEVLRSLEAGVRGSVLAAEYGVGNSTISDIKSQKERILYLHYKDSRTGDTQVVDGLEKKLLEWYYKQNDGVDEAGLRKKAAELTWEVGLSSMPDLWFRKLIDKHNIVFTSQSEILSSTPSTSDHDVEVLIDDVNTKRSSERGEDDKQTFNLRWNEYNTSVHRSVYNMWSCEELVDVTLMCGDRALPAHRLVLSACSGYFRDIFKHCSPFLQPLVCLPDLDPALFELLLEFIYQGEVNVPDKLLNNFLKTAERLKVKGLCKGRSEQCEEILPSEPQIIDISQSSTPKLKTSRIRVPPARPSISPVAKVPRLTVAEEPVHVKIEVDEVFEEDPIIIKPTSSSVSEDQEVRSPIEDQTQIENIRHSDYWTTGNSSEAHQERRDDVTDTTCPICQEDVQVTGSTLIQHYTTSHPDTFYCDICLKTFIHSGQHKQHILTHHHNDNNT